MVSLSPCEFLKAPSFPGAPRVSFEASSVAQSIIADAELDRLVERMRELKVGGTFWGSQPQLPSSRYLLVRVRDAELRAAYVGDVRPGCAVVEWNDPEWNERARGRAATSCDPWHLLSNAEELVVEANDEAAMLGWLAGIPLRLVDEQSNPTSPRDRFRELASAQYRNPYSGQPITFEAAAEICGLWRRLVDSNRYLAGAIGFAFWKRKAVAPLLWNGSADVQFLPDAGSVGQGATVAVWKSRTSVSTLAKLQAKKARIIEVEDGFIRSIGLGADCVPPMSVVVDPIGIYFDPSHPSELEKMLQEHDFPPALLERARALRLRIVELGLSKYAIGDCPIERRSPDLRHLLVIGQVEDDRAVLAGRGPATNLELLQRVRADNPDAYIIYKPHPDVEAGHRVGGIPDDLSLKSADEIIRNAPISSLIGLADEVHVNTSLAGFEALLRHKPVTTYGVPFYAGWGLCNDLGPVPSRRSRRRSLDELVAAALILYPRHLDPVTGLPCPPEILIDRLSASRSSSNEWGLVQLRRIQGKLNRAMAALRQ